jgi:serine/threonine protein kinase
MTADDTVKVLDFGLAKGGAASSGDLAQSPTLTYSPTAVGVILGTAGYMSPEQARGKLVDRRADIWAFGCVLFECLTGRKVFEANGLAIARIIEREPLWESLPPATPPRVRDLLRRCLDKDLKKRQRDIGDVRIELDEVLAARSSVSGLRADLPGNELRSRPARHLAIHAAVLALGAALGIAGWSLVGSNRRPLTTPASVSITVPDTIRAACARFAQQGDTVLRAGFP